MAGQRRKKGEGKWRVLPNGTHERGIRKGGEYIYGYGASYAEADAAMRANVAKVAAGIDPRAGEQSVADYLARWLATDPGDAPTTKRSYRDTVRLHLAPRLGAIRLDRLTAADIEAMMRQGRAAGLSRRTVTIHRDVLRIALNHAIKARLLARNEAEYAAAPSGRSRRPMPLTVREAEALLARVAGTRWHALYATALYTALRAAELLGLRWNDVDFERGEIHVRRQVQFETGRGLVARELKSDSSADSVPLAHDAALVLVAHRALLQGLGLYDAHGPVFPSRTGAHMYPSVLVWRWRGGKRGRARDVVPGDRDRAGLSDRHFHDLRATTASWLHAKGVPMRTIQRVLRHANLATTAGYIQLFDDSARTAVDMLDGVLGVREEMPEPVAVD